MFIIFILAFGSGWSLNVLETPISENFLTSLHFNKFVNICACLCPFWYLHHTRHTFNANIKKSCSIIHNCIYLHVHSCDFSYFTHVFDHLSWPTFVSYICCIRSVWYVHSFLVSSSNVRLVIWCVLPTSLLNLRWSYSIKHLCGAVHVNGFCFFFFWLLK